MDARELADALGPWLDGDDASLADAIETDGRRRLLQGRKITLQHYLDVIPNLAQRSISLDAAIDLALRSLSGGSRIATDAVDQMIAAHPSLERSIRDAAMLNAAIWSTTGLRASVNIVPPKSLPCEFGPKLPTGEHRYQLQRLLGQGGFGQVYLALDRELSEEGHTAMVAIKILAVDDRTSWVRQRLIEEATKVRRISHPNVVMALDRGVTEDDEDYIVYEYVDGGDLTQQTSGSQRMTLEHAVMLMAQIARGVHAAHSAGVIHCDLKPGNIMLTSAGQPKVADFGIAVRQHESDAQKRASHSLHRGSHPATDPRDSHESHSLMGPIGNVAFISPEQYRGEDDALTVQSDVYALGGILFLMLTGELPNGSTRQAIARTHDRERGRTAPPSARSVRPDIDRDLDMIGQRAMAIQPDHRYPSAAALAEDLERWLRREPIPWTRPSLAHVLSLWSRRKPALAASMTALIVLAIVGSVISWRLDAVARAHELEAIRMEGIAKQNELEAAMAKLKADQEESLRLQSRALATQFAQSLREMRDYRIATESLVIIWALEYVYGPKVLGIPEEQRELWKSRIANIRMLVQQAKDNGRGDELEALLWESALGFWLVCDKDYTEAEPLLHANYDRWAARLSSDDHWLKDLRTMQWCAAVNRLHARAQQQALSQKEKQELTRLDADLREACRTMLPGHYATPMHYLMLQSMIDLCSPTLLNQPDRITALKQVMQAQQDRKPVDNPCP